MRHNQRPRRGTVAVLAALCLTGILGFAALSLDAALLLQDRRNAQAAADSAALAAAGNLFLNFRANQGVDNSGAVRLPPPVTTTADAELESTMILALVVTELPPLLLSDPEEEGSRTRMPLFHAVHMPRATARAFTETLSLPQMALKARRWYCWTMTSA